MSSRDENFRPTASVLNSNSGSAGLFAAPKLRLPGSCCSHGRLFLSNKHYALLPGFMRFLKMLDRLDAGRTRSFCGAMLVYGLAFGGIFAISCEKSLGDDVFFRMVATG